MTAIEQALTFSTQHHYRPCLMIVIQYHHSTDITLAYECMQLDKYADNNYNYVINRLIITPTTGLLVAVIIMQACLELELDGSRP